MCQMVNIIHHLFKATKDLLVLVQVPLLTLTKQVVLRVHPITVVLLTTIAMVARIAIMVVILIVIVQVTKHRQHQRL